MSIVLSAALGLLLLVSASASAAVTTTVVDIPTRGVTQRILYLRPDAPKANIVHLPGGTGAFSITDGGVITQGACSPVARNRQAFADQGFAVALVDQTSDGRVYGIADVTEVVRYLRARDAVPTWIIGGSNSTEASRCSPRPCRPPIRSASSSSLP